MTPDGISDKDWDRVKAAACDIANAACQDDDALVSKHNRRIHRLLNRLRAKYGDRPSILATKADYTVHPRKSLTLLTRAYALARDRRDEWNLLFVASSIAQLYIEELADSRRGRLWLARFQRHLADRPDRFERKELHRLRRLLGARTGRARRI